MTDWSKLRLVNKSTRIFKALKPSDLEGVDTIVDCRSSLLVRKNGEAISISFGDNNNLCFTRV